MPERTPEEWAALTADFRRMEDKLQERMDDLWDEWVWMFQTEYRLTDEEMDRF